MVRKATLSIKPHGSPTPAEDFDVLIKAMPALNRLFEIMSRGVMPTTLDVFAGLSQMVAYYTDPDQIPYDRVCELLKSSGIRCLSCS